MVETGAERVETEGGNFAEVCWLLKLLIHWRLKSSVIWCTVAMCAWSVWPFHLHWVSWGIEASNSYLRKKFSWFFVDPACVVMSTMLHVLLILLVLLCLLCCMFCWSFLCCYVYCAACFVDPSCVVMSTLLHVLLILLVLLCGLCSVIV
jgi:hypothetical protein